MGYFSVNQLGDITSASFTPIDGTINLNDEVLFEQIRLNLPDWKFINDEFVHTPRPSLYHRWNGTEWVHDPTLVTAARQEIWERIKTYRQDRQYLGVKITTVSAGDVWIHSDEPSRSLHLGMVGAAILHILHMFLGITSVPPFPSNLYWKTMQTLPNGQPLFILLDYVVALQIYAADKSMTADCFARAEYHRVMLEMSADPWNYNYKTGWPPVFGE